ncbi:hypothetical protein [Pseudoalteromonas sp. BDTF-M6]|uniref:hypothetical protein n=1 Tax=Pseudoalteromonas sp. BDTF-M6 TaxID=2796132 RepID=UPI00201685E6|nr:hypothetical protein [Pseudoalteromonas sp. BDTF-M6]
MPNTSLDSQLTGSISLQRKLFTDLSDFAVPLQQQKGGQFKIGEQMVSTFRLMAEHAMDAPERGKITHCQPRLVVGFLAAAAPLFNPFRKLRLGKPVFFEAIKIALTD